MMRSIRAIATAAAAAALFAGGMSAAHADGFSVTATPTTGVKQGSVITVTTTGLTGTLGVYASICKGAAPGTAPTVCDPDQSHMTWITGTGAPGSAKDAGTITAYSTFTASGTAVNCLVDACVIYVRGDHNNRTDYSLIRTIALAFVDGVAAPVKKTDVASALLNGVEIQANVPGNLQYRTPVELVVRVASGQAVTLKSLTPDCAVEGTKITALKGTGTCAIAASTAGNDTYTALSAAVNYPFYLHPGYQELTSSVVLAKVVAGKAGNIKASQIVSNMGEVVGLTSKTPAACSVKVKTWGWTIVAHKGSKCRLEASAPASDKYTAATLTVTLPITKK